MRVSATKARWFAVLLLGSAPAVLSCRRDSGRSEAACQGAGIVSSRTATLPDGGELAAQIVQSGCGDCAGEVRPGAAPGSPCGAASVCLETCCLCPRSSPKSYYRARVCGAGRCADPAFACEAARLSIRPDVCP